jgi:hypothetical protein
MRTKTLSNLQEQFCRVSFAALNNTVRCKKIDHIYFAYVANVKTYPFGNYRIYHTPLTLEVYAGY